MPEHHDLSPSKFDQIEACPASGLFQKQFPDRISEYAERGTLQHKAVETNDLSGLTDEEAAEVNMCGAYIKSMPEQGVFMHEKKAVLYGPGKQVLTFGTLDLFRLYFTYGILVDWKFGKTEISPDTLQLLVYALAMFQEYRDLEWIDCIIFQPKLDDPIKKKVYWAKEYDIHFERIERIIRMAMLDTPRFIPGEDQCRWCNALRGCKAYAESGLYKQPKVRI